MCDTPGSFVANGDFTIASAQKNSTNEPSSSLAKPLDRLRTALMVENVPRMSSGSVAAGFLFNGALSTYERLGFTRSRQIGKHRWVVTRVVEPA